MIIWINGSFGVGKTTTAKLLQNKLEKAHIYDPEQVGYFLWDNFPPEMARQGDFQDMEIWRSINYQIIRYLHDSYDGDLILPMTLANRQYYDEIIGRLEQDGISVRHFILTAPENKIIERLRGRGDEPNSWAEQQVQRCLAA
ncbi:MAG: AAA family ATPase, partial [Clostridia bacterium]|nr:AAA family ATPase [Clostridia bacterium]